MPCANSVRAFFFLASFGVSTAALSQAEELEDCARIVENGARLACFDDLVTRQRAEKNRREEKRPGADVATRHGSAPPDVPQTETQERSWLAEHWELGPDNKRGTFAFRPHLPNYLIATYTDKPNDAPYRPFRRLLQGDGELSHAELVFQLGFKMKLLENAADSPLDLWFAYTQQSFWQAGNREASSPFRESNYQPEVMAVLPVNFSLLGFKARFVNLGLVHQSNGQASTLSRSWNRVYAQLGVERGDLALVARVWRRLEESASSDDNPDIVDYLGHGDLVGTYRWQGHEFSLLTRYNFDTNKGAAQLGWAFPIAQSLKGYVQFFSGYGNSLIDYNHEQNVLGLGVLISY